MSTRKSQKTVRQRGCSVRRRHGAVKKSVDVADATLRNSFLDTIEGADYALQKIVEVVRDTACELPESLHLLTLPQRFLDLHELAGAFFDPALQYFIQIRKYERRSFLIVDVGICPDPPGDFTGMVSNSNRAHDVPTINPICSE